MKRRNFILATMTAALMVGLPLAASADTLDTIKARGKLLAAIDLGSPPFGMTDDKMQPVGSEVESAKLLADYLGVPLEIVQVTSPNRIPFLLTGKADVVIASLSVSDERKKVIDFADPHGVIQVVVAAPKGTEIKSIEDLTGKEVATTRGTTNDNEATKQLTKSTITRYDDDATLVTALVSGQAGIMASAPQIMNAANERRKNDPLEVKVVLKTNPYAIGVRKEDTALKEAINKWVAQDLKNGKLNEIYKKYNNVDLPAVMPKG